MTTIVTLFKVECHFDWQTENDTSTWHCGSLDGARRLVEKQKADGLLWYSIEGYDYHPCKESDPLGQLYLGMIWFEFKELKEGEWR